MKDGGGYGGDRSLTLTTIKKQNWIFDIGYNLFMCLLLDKTNQLTHSYVCLHMDHKVKRPNEELVSSLVFNSVTSGAAVLHYKTAPQGSGDPCEPDPVRLTKDGRRLTSPKTALYAVNKLFLRHCPNWGTDETRQGVSHERAVGS